jgi:mannose-6-phosphate isomerase-like protein (cupin superfamily)
MIHFHDNERPFKEGDCGPKYLGTGPGYEWGVLVLKPGQGSRVYGRHYHQVVSETFYFLEGDILMWVEGKEFRAKAGDIVTVEPNEKHWLENDSSQDCRAIFMKYPIDPADRVPF